ncbi:MAG: hypothetical protein IPN17_38630 [Deltaproteobacteria bacterium]|nr:hypothetical protein [Deltaproteobacteria bacterium]
MRRAPSPPPYGESATVGLDVGSTTVKVVVTSADSAPIVRCARHQGRLAETVASLLAEVLPPRARLAVTGSGSAVAAPWGPGASTR